MGYKEYLMSLGWNSFNTYPGQGSCIYIHCSADDDGSAHRFFKFNSFNAVSFDPGKLKENLKGQYRWLYSWLPVESINEDYAGFNN